MSELPQRADLLSRSERKVLLACFATADANWCVKIRAISEYLGWAAYNHTQYVLNQLVARGLIQKEPVKHRGAGMRPERKCHHYRLCCSLILFK